MRLGTLQVLQLVGMASIACTAHVAVALLARPYLKRLENQAGHGIASFAAVTHVVAALLYASFALWSLPTETLYRVEGRVPFRAEMARAQMDNLLEMLGIFAVLVAIVLMLSFYAIRRVAQRLEPWPGHHTPTPRPYTV